MGHNEAVTGLAKLVVDFETDFNKHICTTYSKLTWMRIPVTWTQENWFTVFTVIYCNYVIDLKIT